jgi:4-amino-4-deoxy-L-arabinose transferase-like glycosyltransferase
MPAIVFFVAFVFRLTCFIQSFDNPLLYLQILDESYYISLGRAVAAGFMLGEKGLFYMDPLYGYVLGAFFYLFGPDPLYVRIFQIGLDSFNAALVAVIAGRSGGKLCGVAGGLFYALFGPAVFFSLMILKTTLSITLALLFILILLRASRGDDGKWWFALGVTGALAVFTRANHALIVALAPFFHLLIRRPSGARFLKDMAYYLSGLILILSVGAVRSYSAAGEFSILPTQGGRLVYLCQNPDNLTGMHKPPPFSRGGTETLEADFQREAEKRVGKKLSQKEVSNYWTGETLRFIAQNPGAMPLILARKLYGAVADYEIPDNHSYKLWSRFAGAFGLPFPTFAFLLAAGLPGLTAMTLRQRMSAFLWLPVIGTLLTMLVFYPSARFRMEAVPFLAVGAGFCVVLVRDWMARRDKLRLAGLATVFVALFAVSKSFPEGKNSGDEEFFLAKAYLNVNDAKSAWETARSGMELFPDQDRFPRVMGLAAISGGDADTAIGMMNKSLAMRPDSAEAWHNLGLAYLMKGESARAVESLTHAVDHGSGPVSYLALAQACESLGERDKAIGYYERYMATARPGDLFALKARDRVKILRGDGK